MLHAHASLCLAMLVVGCSQTHALEEPDWQSGSRLRAWVHDGGGTRMFVGWRDTELGTDCAMAETADGTLRCFPPTAIATTYFADAHCTDAIVAGLPDAAFVTTSDPSPETDCAASTFRVFGRAPAVADVGVVRAVHRIAGSRPAPTEVYVRAPDGTCSPAPQRPNGNWRARGDEVPLDQFVRAVRARVPGADGLTVVSILADDGARAWGGLLHSETGVQCVPGGSDRLRCVPVWTGLSHGGVYADDACTVPTSFVQFRPASCPAPTLALDVRTSCQPQPLRTVTGLAAASFARADDGTCTPLPVEEHVWSLGSTIDGAALDPIAPPLERHLRGDGPLRVVRYLGPSGGLAHTFGWVRPDGVGCEEITVGPSRDIVCVDTGMRFVGYADAACTQPLANDRQTCGEAHEHVVIGGDILPVGGAYDGPVFDRRGTCQEVPVADGATYYRLGAPIDASTLPHILRVLE